MSDENVEMPLTIEERLAYLEEQNEGLKRVGKLLLGLCLLTGGLLVWTQAGLRKSVYSESVIFGNGSTARSTLTTTPDGNLAFLFYDHLGILPPNPQFGAVPPLDGYTLYDRSGKPRIVMGVNEKDEALFDILSPEGKLIFSATRALPPGSASPAGKAPAPAPAPAPGAKAPAPPAPVAP